MPTKIAIEFHWLCDYCDTLCATEVECVLHERRVHRHETGPSLEQRFEQVFAGCDDWDAFVTSLQAFAAKKRNEQRHARPSIDFAAAHRDSDSVERSVVRCIVNRNSYNL
jgi:IS1 family transposase